jgi:hypothetical protein
MRIPLIEVGGHPKIKKIQRQRRWSKATKTVASFIGMLFAK